MTPLGPLPPPQPPAVGSGVFSSTGCSCVSVYLQKIQSRVCVCFLNANVILQRLSLINNSSVPGVGEPFLRVFGSASGDVFSS